MSRRRHSLSERQLEVFIGNLLRYGIIVATVTVFIGGVLYLIRYGNEAPNYQIFHGEPPAFRTPEGVTHAAFSGRRRGVILFGILLLIATPVVRVAFSLLAFLVQKDTIYIIVTLIVLAGLIFSFVGGH
ncbi:MAG: DUF1634 domain-containing protein [Scytonema sp. PMC 1069.18]|nr:DUF1634 domain-containing protein [Scytonema sp. PMC 1069.18]MEC4880803.1 DUF1634 domain-containing protein [Scytonema sp. PMC 1070.18]